MQNLWARHRPISHFVLKMTSNLILPNLYKTVVSKLLRKGLADRVITLDGISWARCF